MARCPFAQWDEISGPVGPYASGPFKIIHHTTEGTTYAGARAAYAAKRADPHFTVVGTQVYQHIDTELACRALRNPPGGVETNRDSALQIEVVGRAGYPKDVGTLKTVAKLCRLIEEQHGVSQDWPSGPVRWSTIPGKDPGGHNRSSTNWETTGGHYGHSQVPENTHWDPAYTLTEVAIVTPDAVFDPHEELGIERPEAVGLEAAPGPSPATAEQIARRLLPEVVSQLRSYPAAKPPHVRIRVAAEGVEIEVDINAEAAAPADEKPARRRTATRRKTRRRRNL